jgi:hypothetical protein
MLLARVCGRSFTIAGRFVVLEVTRVSRAIKSANASSFFAILNFPDVRIALRVRESAIAFCPFRSQFVRRTWR